MPLRGVPCRVSSLFVRRLQEQHRVIAGSQVLGLPPMGLSVQPPPICPCSEFLRSSFHQTLFSHCYRQVADPVVSRYRCLLVVLSDRPPCPLLASQSLALAVGFSPVRSALCQYRGSSAVLPRCLFPSYRPLLNQILLEDRFPLAQKRLRYNPLQ